MPDIDGLPYPNASDIPDGPGAFLALAQAVDTRLDVITNTRQFKTYKWADAAARTAQTGMTEGDQGYQLDTDILYTYTNSAWLRGTLSSIQLDTTNSTATVVTQYGTGKIIGNNTVQTSELVTFPIAFTSTPRVIIAATGYRAAGAFNDSALSASTNWASAASKSNTNFLALLNISGATLANTLDYYYDWVAIGTI